jgi:hypothetical protein
MVNKFLVASVLLVISSLSNAGVIEPQKIEQSVNDVVEMKSYDNGGIRIFLVDQEEPASRPYKVVVSLPIGGEEYTEYGTFEVGSFCSVNLKKATSKKIETAPWATRVISIPVSRYNPETGGCNIKDTLTLEARLMDDNESSLKASTLKQN